MALNIYLDNNAGAEVTSTNTHHADHDALNGSWVTEKLWLRNDSAAHYYTGVEVSIDITGVTAPNVSPTGVIYQLVPGDIEPTVLEWKHIPYHNSITFSDIGSLGAADTATYYPFWLRTYVPGNSSIGRTSESNLRIQAIERAA
jgi:hypothetical protein